MGRDPGSESLKRGGESLVQSLDARPLVSLCVRLGRLPRRLPIPVRLCEAGADDGLGVGFAHGGSRDGVALAAAVEHPARSVVSGSPLSLCAPTRSAEGELRDPRQL